MFEERLPGTTPGTRPLQRGAGAAERRAGVVGRGQQSANCRTARPFQGGAPLWNPNVPRVSVASARVAACREKPNSVTQSGDATLPNQRDSSSPSSEYYPADIDRLFYPGNILDMTEMRSFAAFSGSELLARGDIERVIRRLVGSPGGGADSSTLVFEESTGTQVDFDLRGTAEEAIARLDTHPLFGAAPGANPRRTGPGRPKLGVVSREVSLLPRHWSWLEAQPGGISGALRRLVDEARRREPGKEQARIIREALGKILWAVAGNFKDFEEASRALYASDPARFAELIAGWPPDVRDYSLSRIHEAQRVESEREAT